MTIAGQGSKESQAATIDVVGDGNLTLYVRGDDSLDFRVGKNSEVDVPGENSSQFRVYGTQDFDADITSDNSPSRLRFEGVIYAPSGYASGGTVTVGQAEVYGAIVAGNIDVKQGGEIHYDEGLADEQFPRSPTVTRLEYLHVSVHPVRVSPG